MTVLLSSIQGSEFAQAYRPESAASLLYTFRVWMLESGPGRRGKPKALGSNANCLKHGLPPFPPVQRAVAQPPVERVDARRTLSPKP